MEALKKLETVPGESDMTHEYEGRYRTKHAPHTRTDPDVAKIVREKSRDKHLTCKSAFGIVHESGASPDEVGQVADLLEIKITTCQLGLFGYGRKKRNIVGPAEKVSAELEEALRKGLVNGKLPCKGAWEVADRFGLSKMEITAACERLGIRFSRCQLGTF
ncbi:MAG: hypothetical protein GTO12_02750 [Proteobacteria bacterium]|nr:hypothetical protein [Pseudomonadota bacterium]